MIELPKRSVTRFFIPLIDVLILLFCIYLLMPIIKGPAESTAEASGDEVAPLGEPEKQELRRLRREVRELQQKSALTEIGQVKAPERRERAATGAATGDPGPGNRRSQRQAVLLRSRGAWKSLTRRLPEPPSPGTSARPRAESFIICSCSPVG